MVTPAQKHHQAIGIVLGKLQSPECSGRLAHQQRVTVVHPGHHQAQHGLGAGVPLQEATSKDSLTTYIKSEVYSLVSHAKHYSPHVLTIIPWSQDLFIYKPSHLPGQHTVWLPFSGAQNQFKHASLPCSSRSPFNTELREFMCE